MGAQRFYCNKLPPSSNKLPPNLTTTQPPYSSPAGTISMLQMPMMPPMWA